MQGGALGGPRRRAPLVLLLATVLVGPPACRRGERPKPPAPSAAPRAASASPHVPSATAAPPAPVIGCRVLGVKGKLPPPADTPGVGALVQGREWLELGAGVELQLKHTETTRELSLLGPGRFRACADGAEAVVVARGSVTTTAGPGSRPGAEVQLATPLGVVHYADAALRLDVSEQTLELQVKQGSAALSATVNEDRSGGAAPEPVRAPKGKLTLTGPVDAPALVTRCAEAQSRISEKIAAAVPGSGRERGAWAVQLLDARKAARFACARARAAAGRLDGEARVRLEDQLSGGKSAARGASDAESGLQTDAGK